MVASSGVFSTGVNIVNLHNIISSASFKSRVRTLQSIGRGLRKGELKTNCVWIDITDDLTHKGKQNYSLKHFLERVKIYNKEDFEYKIKPVRLK